MDKKNKTRIDQLQPSQPYLSQGRLNNISRHTDFLNRPVPVRLVQGRLCIVEGHERCFALASTGITEVETYIDTCTSPTEAEFQDLVNYTCDKGVSSIHDLEDHVLSPAEFRHVWLEKKKNIVEGKNKEAKNAS